jgi:hypothetical protein
MQGGLGICDQTSRVRWLGDRRSREIQQSAEIEMDLVLLGTEAKTMEGNGATGG